MRAMCPGSFDPVTFGHLDIITRASALFGEVVVAVGRNSSKNYLFTAEERRDMLAESCVEIAGVEVVMLDGLLVDFAAAHGCSVVVKGLRFAGDFEFELQMAQLNEALSGIETVLLPTAARWGHLSSTMIREVALFGGDVSQFVPAGVAARIKDKVAGRRKEDS